MCAELNSIKPVGASYKRQVPPVENSVRITVADPALCAGDGVGEAGENNCTGRNAISVKEIEPREAHSSVMAELVYGREGNTGVSRQPGETTASPGSKTTACAKGIVRELGKTLGGRKRIFKFPGQGASSKFGIIPQRVIRCLRSSWEVG